MSHHRVAVGYLRTGNVDLASLEIEGLREAWAKVSTLPRPAAFADTQRYTSTMLQIAAGLVGTTLVINLGRPDVARESLETDAQVALRAAAREPRHRARRLRARRQHRDGRAVRARTQDRTARAPPRAPNPTAATLQRCDGMAPRAIHDHAEFRRLIDGARASLAQIPKAAETRDADLLHRLLIELRSFDNLLAFRYG